MIKERNFFGFFVLMMNIHEAKSPKQIHFRNGWDERIFFEKHKTTNKHFN